MPIERKNTLPKDQIIPDSVAKRLAWKFRLRPLALNGAIHDEDTATVAAMQPHARETDPVGFDADRRAMLDYLRHYGPRTAVEDWERLLPSTDVVPWSYGH